jgi:dienelactone hydrolase
MSGQETTARAFLDELAHGAWDHPKTHFSEKMSAALPPDRLRAAWSEVESVAGRFFECRAAKQDGQAVLLECVYEKSEKTIKVVLDEQGAVAGLWFEPSRRLLEERVRAMVEKANDGDFAGAEHDFGDVMRGALPPDKLSGAWKQLGAQVGRFQSIEKVTFATAGGKAYETVAIARFERAKIQVKAIWDASDKMIGLFFVPDNPWTPPSYARPDDVADSEIAVGDKPALPGLLSMPKKGDSLPAVVLVHGSGPGDRDEAVGGVKVFRDLAMGLAARGVVVLRYDKRTRVSPAGVVTEKEEVLDGAYAALDLLRKTPRVNKQRLFVIGHSQGGGLAPRIASGAPDIAGYVTMAGNTRPLQDLVIDQYEFFSKLHPKDEELKKKVEAAKEFKKRVEDPALRPNDDPHSPIGGGMTGAYFLYQRGYDPVATAQKLGLPIFVAQGGRDYQVTSKDYDRWKSGLGTSSFATLKWYPSLNHLFTAGEGDPSPEEYEKPSHVDAQVVTDIADFILKTPAR